MRATFIVITLALMGATGCQCDGDDEPSSREGTGGGPVASTGVVEGVVRLAADAELPGFPTSPMVGENRPDLPESCSPPRREDRYPVTMGSARGLAGVAVSLADFGSVPEGEPRTHEVSIDDCRLTPTLLIAKRGDTMRITNPTRYPFFPTFGGSAMQGLLHEQTRDIELSEAGMRTLQCGFTAPCGRLDIITLFHRLATISGEDGAFRIEDVPAGSQIRAAAWHPLLEGEGQTFAVRGGETTRIELIVRPGQMASPTPADEGETGDGEEEAEEPLLR